MKAIIVQARVGSTRLPNKVLTPFYGSKTILEIILDNLQRSKHGWPIIVATTTSKADDSIAVLCNSLGVECTRGLEDDVLQRFIDTAKPKGISTIARVCADNPFLSTQLLGSLIDSYNQHPSTDYVSYFTASGTPTIKTHWGVFAEIVSLVALEKTTQLTHEKLYHEHVTNYIYGNPQHFSIHKLDLPAYMAGKEHLRFTVDTPDDFTTMQSLYTKFYPNFTIEEIIAYVETEPSILSVMSQNINKFNK